MNSKWHLYTSILKSIIRIVGAGIAIIFSQWIILAASLIMAEILGVLEEIKDER